MSGECWVAVRGYEGIYAVSDRGRILSSISRRPNKNGEYFLSPAFSKGNDYPHVLLYKEGHRKSRRVASIVMESFVGPRPKGKEINHKDGVKSNSQLLNLEYSTPSENVRHAYKSGLNKGLVRFDPSNTTGYRGVSFTPWNNWRSSISVDGKHIHLGTFGDPIEAARAYDQAVLRYRKTPSYLNFSEGK